MKKNLGRSNTNKYHKSRCAIYGNRTIETKNKIELPNNVYHCTRKITSYIKLGLYNIYIM